MPDAQRRDVHAPVREAAHRRARSRGPGRPRRRRARRRARGRRRSTTSAVQAPNWPILWSLGATVRPGVPAGTRKVEMPRRARGVGVGAGEDHEDVGERRVGDVALGAVDHPVVAVRGAPRGEVDGIGARVGLGERERGQSPRRRRSAAASLLLLRRCRRPSGRARRCRCSCRTSSATTGSCSPARTSSWASSVHRQPQPAVLLGQREAEQAHLLGRLADRPRASRPSRRSPPRAARHGPGRSAGPRTAPR